MRIFDCFTFFNELDLLELRLSELAPVVDRFVIAESPLTFTGREKPLFFEQNRARFAPYLDKIEHVVVRDMQDGPGTSAWEREWHQRRALIRGIGTAAPDDLIMLSDLDEIPRQAALARLKPVGAGAGITILESNLSLGYANTRPVEPYYSLVQAPRLLARKNLRDFQSLRAFRARTTRSSLAAPLEPLLTRARALLAFGAPLGVTVVPDSAWHFSYLGGADAIREKLLSYAHTEAQTAEGLDLDTIAKGLASRTFHLGQLALHDVDVDESFPGALRDNPEKWAHLMAPARS